MDEDIFEGSCIGKIKQEFHGVWTCHHISREIGKAIVNELKGGPFRKGDPKLKRYFRKIRRTFAAPKRVPDCPVVTNNWSSPQPPKSAVAHQRPDTIRQG